MTLTRLFAIFSLGLALSACDTGSDQPQLGECTDNAGCTGLQACINSDCVDVNCLSNEDCQVGQFCDPDADWSCVEGCSRDTDCLAGQTCDDEGYCVEGECVDQHIDCEVGQLCADDGSCEGVEGFCQLCSPGDPNSCPEDFTCHHFDKENVDYCMMKCDNSTTIDSASCPARAECFGMNTDAVCLIGCPDLAAIGAI